MTPQRCLDVDKGNRISGALLIQAMSVRGLSFQALSNKSGVPKRTLLRWTSGPTMVAGFKQLGLVSAALGMDRTDFFSSPAQKPGRLGIAQIPVSLPMDVLSRLMSAANRTGVDAAIIAGQAVEEWLNRNEELLRQPASKLATAHIGGKGGGRLK